MALTEARDLRPIFAASATLVLFLAGCQVTNSQEVYNCTAQAIEIDGVKVAPKSIYVDRVGNGHFGTSSKAIQNGRQIKVARIFPGRARELKWSTEPGNASNIDPVCKGVGYEVVVADLT